jgi:diguanylate cyclase (GGDEF)-like protein
MKQQKQAITAKISSRGFPLWLLLILPSFLIIALTASLTGYIGFISGRKAVNDLVARVRDETTTHIEEHVRNFLQTPHEINQLNAAALKQGWLKTADAETLQSHFLEQVKINDNITSVYFGSPNGDIIGSGREGGEDTYYVYSTDELSAFNKYIVAENGEVLSFAASIPNFDTRTRPWYINAVQKAAPAWSDVYILFTGQDMALSASLPVYDDGQKLLGVVSVDIFLSQIQEFLTNLEISASGQSFIMERSGLLIATSTGERPIQQGSKGLERLHVSQIQNPVVKNAMRFLETHLEEKDVLLRREKFEFEFEQETYFLDIAPIRDQYGIDWIMVVIIPESDFMMDVRKANQISALIIILCLAGSIYISVLIAQKIASRISHLNDAAQSLTTDSEETTELNGSRIHEINEVTVSFTDMRQQLRQALNELRTEVQERKQAEAKLETANNELTKAFEREQTLARTDGMTGLHNYRSFFDLATREFRAALRYHHSLTILMLDVDHFKKINDSFGHAAGDQLLAQVAQILALQIRAVDILARYGGDEFIILLPQTSAQQAFPLAERIRTSIENLQVNLEEAKASATLSVGISEIQKRPMDENIEQIIKRADQALYMAKQRGRNHTAVFHTQE